MGNLDISDDDEDGSGRRRKKQRRRARELGKEDALAELRESATFSVNMTVVLIYPVCSGGQRLPLDV